MATISQLAIGLSLNSKGFREGITQAVAAVQDIGETAAASVTGIRLMGGAAEETEGQLAGLARQAKSTVAAFLGFATAAGGIGYGVKLAADAEQTETAFATMLKSADKAKELMADIRSFEAATPLNLAELERSGRSLVAFGTAQEQVIPTLQVLGDVASGVQMPLNELADLYGKSRVEGRMFMKDVYQYTGRGIPIVAELAKQFQVAESEISTLVSDGQVGFADLQQALVSLTSEGGLFAGAMEAQSKTLSGVFSSLQSAVESLFRTFGTAFATTAGLADGVVEITEGVNAFQSVAALAGTVLGAMAGWVLKLGKLLVPVIAFVKIFVFVVTQAFNIMAALVAIKIAQWAAAFVGLSLKIILVQGAMLLLRSAYFIATAAVVVFHAMSGPAGWAILATGAVIAAGAVMGLAAAYDMATEAMKGHDLENKRQLAIEQRKVKEAQKSMEWTAQMKRAEARAAQIKPAVDAVAKTQFDLRTAGLTEAQKELVKIRDAMVEINRTAGEISHYTDGTTFEQQAQLMKLRHAQHELSIVEKQFDIRQEMLKAQKEAAQVGMTSGQKMLDDLRRMGATWQQMHAAQRAARQLDEAEKAKEQAKERIKQQEDLQKQGERLRKSLETPLESYKKQLADIAKLRQVGAIGNATAARAMVAAEKDYLMELRKGAADRAVESPTALMAGTAEAALANDRLKTPIETMADINRRQLAEARRTREATERMLAHLRSNPVQEVNIPG